MLWLCYSDEQLDCLRCMLYVYRQANHEAADAPVRGYLPSERAVRGGGYGAVIQSSRIGPEGGQVLVDRTLEATKALWPESR